MWSAARPAPCVSARGPQDAGTLELTFIEPLITVRGPNALTHAVPALDVTDPFLLLGCLYSARHHAEATQPASSGQAAAAATPSARSLVMESGAARVIDQRSPRSS